MRNPLSHCPICAGHLEPVKLKCPSCDLTLEGKLPASRLALLSPDQQQFVEVFLVARGNIREVEKALSISYPTVRKKLDEVVVALGYAPHAERLEREEILEAIDKGEISAKEGIALLKAGGKK
ncbi:MAG: DUF2089 domain-containing protein [Candidatus Poribacteria bacterium]|nr:DUF2089 domain-containing protein [Candidatus Poribacteria bacterium]